MHFKDKPPHGVSRHSFRMLFAGVSNMKHLWHAVGEDDVQEFDPMPSATRAPDRVSPHCPPSVPDHRLSSFAPHSIDFQRVDLLTPGAPVSKAKL